MKPPLVYHAHPITREFIGASQASPDPMAKGEWLIPAQAYRDAPPATPKGSVAQRTPDEKQWQIVENHRGILYSISTGEPMMLDELGPLPEGYTSQPKPGPYHVWNGQGWELDGKAERAALREAVSLQCEILLRRASMRMAAYQDAIDLDELMSEEQDEIIAWKQYRIALNRIWRQPGYPKTIEWPTSPEEEV